MKNLKTQVTHSYKFMGAPLWAQDSRHLLVSAGIPGSEANHIFELDTDNPDLSIKDLTPHTQAAANVLALIPDSLDFLFTSNLRESRVSDLYRYRYESGKIDLVMQNPGDVATWFTNEQGILVGRSRKADRHWLIEKYTPNDRETWKQIFSVSQTDEVNVLGWNPHLNSVWALSNRGRDKLALVALSLEDGSETVFFEDARVDLSSVFISAKTHKPLMVTLDPADQEIHTFDKRLESAMQQLMAQGAARFFPISISRDDNVLTGVVVRDNGGQNVMYNQIKNEWTILSELSRSRINAISPLPITRPLQFKSRDGLPLNGYLTLPHEPKQHPMPTVVYVHGGPWTRDTMVNDSMPFFLANRGYAVLRVNFRGSSGYGRAFKDAARGEFAGKMQNDLLDGVDMLIQQGISDPNKIAIMGGSYGGYASLVGLTFTPEKFACAISMGGVSDLARLIEHAPPSWTFGLHKWHDFVGDPSRPSDRQAMDSKSPLYRASQATKPLLIFHGDRDIRVKVDQSIRMVDALQASGKPVEFVRFKNEGHSNYSWESEMIYYRKTEDFLQKCLGGENRGFDFFELKELLF